MQSDDIVPISTFARTELKFVINIQQYKYLLEEVKKYMHPDIYCKDGKEYGVYNIYYDTHDNYLVRESLNKPFYKDKLRLRTYFSPASPTDWVYLEIKRKVGTVVVKRRVTWTYAQAMEYLVHGKKPEANKYYINNQVFSEIDVFMNNYELFPKQYISYMRYAFFGHDDIEFRLTFDRKIMERHIDLELSSPSYGSKVIGDDERILEVKIDKTVPLWLARKMSELDIYRTSYSKYGTAYTGHIQDKLVTNMGDYLHAI